MDITVQNGLKRRRKLAEWEKRMEMLHQKYPRLEEISILFARISLELVLVELGTGKMAMSREELLKAQEALREEKESIIRDNRLPPNICDVWWDCEKCEDTGFVKLGVKCGCRIQEEMAQRWQVSGLSPEQEKQTFATFSLDWYEDKERHHNILKKCLDFAEKVSRGEKTDNLLIYGPIGTGKTHLCSAIANYVLQAGVNVIYLKMGFLLDFIREAKFNREQENSRLDVLYRSGLLILDDLGTENLTDFAQEQLFLLLDERINHNLPWVISTNLSPNELDAHYELRLMDRIAGTAEFLKFTGDSIRRRKKVLRKSTEAAK